MKQFKDFNSAFKWAEKVVHNGIEKSREVVSEQIYKDSNEFTYRESGEMYDSGEAHSNFKEGIIVERKPYVRRRYYEGGRAGAGNPKAQPHWFDKTVSKHKKEYNQMIVNAINQCKKGG